MGGGGEKGFIFYLERKKKVLKQYNYCNNSLIKLGLCKASDMSFKIALIVSVNFTKKKKLRNRNTHFHHVILILVCLSKHLVCE